jgi:hypothetical protein
MLPTNWGLKSQTRAQRQGDFIDNIISSEIRNHMHTEQGVCCGLAIYIKKYLKAKEEL